MMKKTYKHFIEPKKGTNNFIVTRKHYLLGIRVHTEYLERIHDNVFWWDRDKEDAYGFPTFESAKRQLAQRVERDRQARLEKSIKEEEYKRFHRENVKTEITDV